MSIEVYVSVICITFHTSKCILSQKMGISRDFNTPAEF